MITDLFSADVAAGKKSNEVMYLSSAELKAAGIDTVGQLRCISTHTIQTGIIFSRMYIQSLRQSEFANMDATPKMEGQELYNDKWCKDCWKNS